MLEQLLAQAVASGFGIRLTGTSRQWQCDIWLGSNLNYICHCGETIEETVTLALEKAKDLKQPEKKKLDLDDILNNLI